MIRANAMVHDARLPADTSAARIATGDVSLSALKTTLASSIRGVEQWVEAHAYKGYEPFDGLNSFLRPFTFGNLLADRVLMQLIRQSPINLRPILGVSPLESTKGRGYMASGYLAMFHMTGETQYLERAERCLAWLMEHKSPKYTQYSWANCFDFASRGGRYSRDESIIVWTALIGQVFLDAYEVRRSEKYIEVASSVCEWILALPRLETDSGTCLSYLTFQREFIHNSSMLGAAMLARAGRILGNTQYTAVAREAIKYSCSRQLADGAWYYGDEAQYHWIDSFHTGYNLDSLRCYIDNTGDREYEGNLRKGVAYFCDHFVERDGLPKYYHNRRYPIDIQCAAQAIDTLARFADYDDRALKLGGRVAWWSIANMQDADGHFYYRKYPLLRAKTPMLHWGQATMYKGLTSLLAKISR